MSRLIKTLLLAVAGIVALLVLSAGALLLFFDPNDFRDEIAAQVEKTTGRELVIDGDLSISLFPWLAVEMGRTSLGNAEGFGEQPFARFNAARLSVRLFPLLLRQEISVGTASLEGLELNLAIDKSGKTNWDDLTSAAATDDSVEVSVEASAPRSLDIANVSVSEATITYRDAAAGSEYRLTQARIGTGRIALGEPFEVDAEFDFSVAPGEFGGHVQFKARTTLAGDFSAIDLVGLSVDGNIEGIAREATPLSFRAPAIAVDLDNSRVAPGELQLAVLGLDIDANVEAFSYSGDVHIPATITVARFSLTELLQTLAIDAPVTLDATALQQVAFSANATMSPDTLALSSLSLTLDDTTLNGSLSLPLTSDAPIEFDLTADRINLDRYMAPPAEAAAAADTPASDDFEIPVDTIRSLKARGSLRVEQAMLSGMTFTNVQLGLSGSDDKLRLHPLSAALFEGSYNGDIRIDASGSTPSLSVDEKVSGVQLTPLAAAMFERDNLSGTINGKFALTARGNTLSEMRSRLNGTMSFELLDGAWEGIDLWYQLRRARAVYRQEAPPAPANPPRTKFSSVVAGGAVTDGIFDTSELLAELPFLRVSGGGTVNMLTSDIDFALQARVLERPEFVSGASDAELAEFTEALIPVRVRGTLTEPSVRPDIEAMFRQEVEDTLQKEGDRLKRRVLDRLLERGEEAPAEGEPPTEGEAPAEDEEPDVEDELKDRLKDLFRR